jgi:pyruvate/2-oxoglutarate dehydrogenase complex dihydrolipoamide acyltransferase (E2) component
MNPFQNVIKRTVTTSKLAPIPMFPSVVRLLEENGISPDQVKGTGVRGMLTKGDVLAFMGKASSPTGTWRAVKESPFPKVVPKPTKVTQSQSIGFHRTHGITRS